MYRELHGHQWPCEKGEGTAFGLQATTGVGLRLAQVVETAILQARHAVRWSEKVCPPFGHALRNGRYLSVNISVEK